MKNAAGLALAAALALALLHASPFWPWRALCGPLAGTGLCDPAGPFGLTWLNWQSDWVARATWGGPLQDLGLLVWAGVAFAALTLAQMTWDRLGR